MSIDTIVNTINDYARTIGAVSGAMDALAPAAMSVNNTLNSVASTFMGTDSYAPYPYPYPYPPVQPQPFPTNGTDSIIGIVGKAAAGGVASYMYSKPIANIIKPGTIVPKEEVTASVTAKGVGTTIKGIGSIALKAGGIGALVSGGVSLLENAVKVMKKEEGGAQAAGNVVADAAGGVVSGVVGSTAGGLAMAGFGAGLGGTIAGTVIGVATAVGADFLYRKSGIKQGLANGITKLFGGQQTYPTYPPYGGYPAQPGYGYPQTPYGYGYPYQMAR